MILLICTVAITSPAQTFTTLFSFNGTDGANTFAGLVQGFNGNFFGTAPNGGSSIGSTNCPFGCGTIFELTRAGKLTTLYTFCSQTNCVDGEFPYGTLVQAANGSLYGMTVGGGTSGNGTVFEVTPAGGLSIIYNFCAESGCSDGASPFAGLIQGASGNFFGTTAHGGANNTCPEGCGTVFEITPAGKLTSIYSFCSLANCADGEYPEVNLVQAANGSLYGTTGAGGNPICTNGCGTVFEITAEGKLTTLYSFCSQAACADGQLPAAGLVQDADGNLYGTTSYGGARNSGTVFGITPQGVLTTLYSFCLQNLCADGSYPYAGLVQAANGKLYGATGEGGAYGQGGLFEINAAGKFVQLHSFCSQNDCTDGANPEAALTQATDGKLYGTTYGGGIENSDCTYGCGTVFGLSSGLSPFVETLPTSGTVGEGVTILGNHLTGSTAVSFNGTSAKFAVVSPTEIKTIVPSGATTGKVTVTAGDGPLASNAVFRVVP